MQRIKILTLIVVSCFFIAANLSAQVKYKPKTKTVVKPEVKKHEANIKQYWFEIFVMSVVLVC